MRNLPWLLFDFVIGVLAAGLVAPAIIVLLPAGLRGPAALAVVAVLTVVVVSLLRRVTGFGSVGRPR